MEGGKTIGKTTRVSIILKEVFFVFDNLRASRVPSTPVSKVDRAAILRESRTALRIRGWDKVITPIQGKKLILVWNGKAIGLENGDTFFAAQEFQKRRGF